MTVLVVQVIHAKEPIGGVGASSVYLAGPPTIGVSPDRGWRRAVLKSLRRKRFTGTVIIPEDRGWQSRGKFESQITWEWAAFEKVELVAFWIPGDLKDLPGFTEAKFGMLADCGKLVVGAAPDTPGMLYIDSLCERHGIDTVDSTTALAHYIHDTI